MFLFKYYSVQAKNKTLYNVFSGWDDWDWVDNNSSNSSKTQAFHQQQQQQQFLQNPHQQTNLAPQAQEHSTAHIFNSMNLPPPPPLPQSPQIDQYGHQQQQQQPIQAFHQMQSTDSDYENRNSGPYSINAINNNHINYQQQQQQQYTTSESPYVTGNHQNSVNNHNNNHIPNSSSNFVQPPLPNYNHNQQPMQTQQIQWPTSSVDPKSVESNETNTINAFATPPPQQQPSASYQHFENHEEHTLPPPPIFASPAVENGHADASQTPNLQLETQPMNTSIESTSSIPTFNSSLPPVLPPPALNQSPFANTNPFKRVGSHAHRTPPPPPVSQPQHQAQSQPQSLPPMIVDNFVNQSQRPHHENDTISHNDRNEYLQTGHLSEDGELGNSNSSSVSNTESPAQNSSDGNGDSLPPPGLSRLVLGEPETSDSSSIQPPPGLDRLIPGTEINRATDISLERQADGQDTSEVPPVRSNQYSSMSQPMTPLTPMSASVDSQSFEHVEAVSESDRNQYLVTGESLVDNTSAAIPPPISSPASNIQRVVTGVENEENQDISARENQRELEMDGENLEDQQQQQIQARHSVSTVRDEEPIGAANNLTQSDSIEDLDVPTSYNQKTHSNPSTGNDDSDREKPVNYSRSKGSSNRRSEDRNKKRDNDNRYETEDTDHSVRERRRPKDDRRGYERSGYEKDRNYRGRSVDVDENDSRAYRDGRRDKHYRPASRDDEDRYERRRYRDDKYNRYETDGSRYENEERPRRRNDRDRDYARYERADRNERYYRSKDYERENRDGRGKN